MPWVKLRFFSAARQIYGLRIVLLDLRMSNVSQIVTTHEQWSELRDGTAESIARGVRPRPRLVNPALSWLAAADFYQATVGGTWAGSLAVAQAARLPHARQPLKVALCLWQAMQKAEQPRWREYLRRRVGAKGWDGCQFLRQLARLPRSLPQGHRWFLLKVHLNAPITTGRIASAGLIDAADKCAFCPTGKDSIAHLGSCQRVMSTYDRLLRPARLAPLVNGQASLMLQDETDGATRAATVAFFAAAWQSRAAARIGGGEVTDAELSDLVLTAIECPWLDFCLPTQQRKERRKERARVPPPVIPLDHATYRSDGACCATDRRGGWGAAYWAPGGQGRGASDENAYGHLGSSSTNNIAEYEGFRRALRRAVEAAAEPCVFEVDSQNVARQINGVNACRDKTLTPVYDDCLRLLGILT